MIIVADSGSTKCDWLAIDPSTKEVDREVSTIGFNPFFHNVDHILDALNKNAELVELSGEVTDVSYFGASCSSDGRKRVLHTALSKFYFNATDIVVEHDLIGAAYASCDGKPGIACILGTGSNAGYFDGQSIVQESNALGYVMGDEGSGSHMGKQLLRDFLYDELPSQIRVQLIEEFEITRDRIFENVYSKPFPNVYLASFAPFLSKNRHYYYVRKLVRRALIEFLDRHVCTYENYEEVPVHFIGSIAFYYEDILREITAHKGIQVGAIIKQPVHNIAKWLLHDQKVSTEA